MQIMKCATSKQMLIFFVRCFRFLRGTKSRHALRGWGVLPQAPLEFCHKQAAETCTFGYRGVLNYLLLINTLNSNTMRLSPGFYQSVHCSLDVVLQRQRAKHRRRRAKKFYSWLSNHAWKLSSFSGVHKACTHCLHSKHFSADFSHFAPQTTHRRKRHSILASYGLICFGRRQD